MPGHSSASSKPPALDRTSATPPARTSPGPGFAWRLRHRTYTTIQVTIGSPTTLVAKLAGRPVTRSAELTLLTTTSLYGLGSSQYNRLHLRRRDHSELSADIRWLELGSTVGFGTVHLARETVDALRELSHTFHRARRMVESPSWRG
jgi:hypothetical protein